MLHTQAEARSFLIALVGLCLACSADPASSGGTGSGGTGSGGTASGSSSAGGATGGSSAVGTTNMGGSQNSGGMAGSGTTGGGTGGAGGGSTGGGGSAAAGSGGASGGSSGGSGGTGANPDAGTPGGKALLVSRNPQYADAALTKRLQGLGFQVTRVVDTDPEAPGPFALIVISEAVESADLGSKYANRATPIVTSEQNYVDKLFTGTKGLKNSDKTTIQIDTPHPIAAGLTGKVEVYTKPYLMTTSGAVPAAVTKVATEDGAPTHFALMALEKGGQLNGVTAPARRAYWFLEDDRTQDPVTLNLTADGWKIFDACVKWATGQP